MNINKLITGTPNTEPSPESEETKFLRDLLLKDEQYLTDLPEDVQPFADGAVDAIAGPLYPKDLDKLEPGAYSIYFAGEGEQEPYVVARSVIIRQGPKGLVVDSECFEPTFGIENSSSWTYIEGSEGLLLSLGYEFTPDESGFDVLTGIPTPETLRVAAAEYGIEIEFFEEKEIRSPEYLATIAAGKYPVSYKNYSHDIGDDHITAFVLGGEPMKASLMRIAQEALHLDRDKQDQITEAIDSFTNIYRAVQSVGFDKKYGFDKSGREYLYEIGKLIGLTTNEIESIIHSGIASSIEFKVA